MEGSNQSSSNYQQNQSTNYNQGSFNNGYDNQPTNKNVHKLFIFFTGRGRYLPDIGPLKPIIEFNTYEPQFITEEIKVTDEIKPSPELDALVAEIASRNEVFLKTAKFPSHIDFSPEK